MRRLTCIAALVAAAGVAVVVAGCGGGGAAKAGGPVTLTYGLWDSNQQPVYQKCADAFERQNPGIHIDVRLTNWNDYWGTLARGFIGDTAPDVFADHVAKYPQFADSGAIMPINRFVARDHVNVGQYLPGLADLWKTPSGKRYGLPKDWDTVAIVSNLGMLQKAGISKQQLDDATWNPRDGGTFEKIVAHLTIDKNGVRGDQPGFDPHNVAVYGLGLDTGGLTYGQTTWAGFARSLGFKLLNRNPWGTHYNFDDPRFIATIEWWRHMIVKGYMPPLSTARTLGQTAAFPAGKIALAIDGDWTIPSYTASKGIKVGFSPQPAGPEGRWSMYNGLADSISARTPHPQAAWKWVKFLASPACENIVGDSAVVFPAIPSGVRRSVAAHTKQHVDVSAFTSYLKAKHTLLYPITAQAAQINLIVQPTIEKILIGDADPASTLRKMNEQVNNILKYR